MEAEGMRLPPIDVIIGLVGVVVFGLILGALIALPYIHRHSKLSLERLSGDLIWRYKPDWIILATGSTIFLILSFVVISGWKRV